MTCEMMLDYEELSKVQSIGLHHILDEALVTLAVLETGPSKPKESELHVSFSLPVDHREQQKRY